MKAYMITIIAMGISGCLFMLLSIKLSWSKRIWKRLNKKIKQPYAPAWWLIFSCIFVIGIQILFSVLNWPYTEIVRGISLGIMMAFMPSLGEWNQGETMS